MESKDLTDERLCALKNLMPEAFSEGGIDFEKLRLLLGDAVEDERERYAFTWPGKRASILQSQTPSTATLRPCMEKSRGRNGEDGSFDSNNVYIEGDNLEVLKLLQRAYHGQVKMIYIDPPYNTGNDFVYHDKFGDTIANYKEQAGLSSQSNPETSGRYHSDWCSMMYPRLKLARELLAADGAIFVSIDDNEVDNLKKICNEVYGEDNVEILIWNKEAEGSSGTLKQVATTRRIHEYIVCAYKDKTKVQFQKVHEAIPGRENELSTANLAVNEANESKDHENYFSITNPNGDVFTRQWKWNKEHINQLIEEDLIYWGSDGHKQPRLIIPMDERRTTFLLSILNYGGTTVGSKDFKETMEGDVEFSYPKPVILLKKLLGTATESNSLILDFFSGSATTAHAVMKLNAEDGGNRRHIMVQLPEVCKEGSEAEKAGFSTICEIGEERIRRAGDKIKERFEAENAKPKLDGSQKELPDIGFRVFKLDESGIEVPKDGTLLEQVVKPGRSDEDIIFECALKMGLDLTVEVKEQTLVGYDVYVLGERELVCCMNKVSPMTFWKKLPN